MNRHPFYRRRDHRAPVTELKYTTESAFIHALRNRDIYNTCVPVTVPLGVEWRDRTTQARRAFRPNATTGIWGIVYDQRQPKEQS